MSSTATPASGPPAPYRCGPSARGAPTNLQALDTATTALGGDIYVSSPGPLTLTNIDPGLTAPGSVPAVQSTLGSGGSGTYNVVITSGAAMVVDEPVSDTTGYVTWTRPVC